MHKRSSRARIIEVHGSSVDRSTTSIVFEYSTVVPVAIHRERGTRADLLNLECSIPRPGRIPEDTGVLSAESRTVLAFGRVLHMGADYPAGRGREPSRVPIHRREGGHGRGRL
eukprot:COSAG02_NODE_848_length_16553_cov_21.228577_3_plen_113_part_00